MRGMTGPLAYFADDYARRAMETLDAADALLLWRRCLRTLVRRAYRYDIKRTCRLNEANSVIRRVEDGARVSGRAMSWTAMRAAGASF